jgi:predicted GIY-YIG superfamily endonuclease
MTFYTYILRCADDSYYTGHTDDIETRMNQHREAADGYVSERKPFSVEWIGEFETRAEALSFELKLKGWSRAKKFALINGDWNLVSRLSKSPTARSHQPFDRLRANGTGSVRFDQRGAAGNVENAIKILDRLGYDGDE